jgi:hypothetical protein
MNLQGAIVCYGIFEGKGNLWSMTRNQRLVLQWLQDNCPNSCILRVSNRELESIFNWSHQYTQKILSSLVSAGHLVELEKGIGRRATKYRVSFSGNKIGASGNKLHVAQYVPSDNKKTLQKDRFTLVGKKTLFGIGLGENAHPNTHIRKQNPFKDVAHPLKHVRTKATPFKRFRGHWDNVKTWTATDFVCYFSYVHRVRFGDEPALNWPVECGAARTLLRRLKKPENFKAFIQVAFGICKRKPNGLRSFVYDYFYEQVVGVADDYTEGFQDEYDDDYVFPWLYQKVKQEGIAASVEYNARLTRRAFGIYD